MTGKRPMPDWAHPRARIEGLKLQIEKELQNNPYSPVVQLLRNELEQRIAELEQDRTGAGIGVELRSQSLWTTT